MATSRADDNKQLCSFLWKAKELFQGDGCKGGSPACESSPVSASGTWESAHAPKTSGALSLCVSLKLPGSFLNTALVLRAQVPSGLVSLREGGRGTRSHGSSKLGASLVMRGSGLCSQMAKSHLLYAPGSTEPALAALLLSVG